MKAHVIDVNTSFGQRLNPATRFSLEALLGVLDAHRVALALSFSRQGVEYSPVAGNTDALAAARASRRIIPVGRLNPKDYPGWTLELDRCLKAGVRAFRFFPVSEGWTVPSAMFQKIMERLRGKPVCLIMPLNEAHGGGAELAQRYAEATVAGGRPLILADVYYNNMAEVIAVMQKFPHVHAETHWLASKGAVDLMVKEVGVKRLLFGSEAPVRSMQKALNQVLEADVSDGNKTAILGGNAMRLLGLTPERVKSLPELNDLQPKRFAEDIIDVHSHLGYYPFAMENDDCDPAGMLAEMRRYGIAKSIVSSVEAIRYDIAAGNRKLADAIAGHPELLGYVELNPHDLVLSCAEMDRYYTLPNFVGCEIELTHIPAPTGGEKVRSLMREIARRGKPVLFEPQGQYTPNGEPQAERDLGRENPNLTIIHAHGFNGEWAQGVADTANICVEFNLSRPSHHDLMDSLRLLGPERVLFGTDQTLLSVGASVGLYLDGDMNADQRRLVLRENARKYFHL